MRDVCHAVCGDSIWTPSEEECDDGNALPLDGCDEHCRIEPGFTCTQIEYDARDGEDTTVEDDSNADTSSNASMSSSLGGVEGGSDGTEGTHNVSVLGASAGRTDMVDACGPTSFIMSTDVALTAMHVARSVIFMLLAAVLAINFVAVGIASRSSKRNPPPPKTSAERHVLECEAALRRLEALNDPNAATPKATEEGGERGKESGTGGAKGAHAGTSLSARTDASTTSARSERVKDDSTTITGSGIGPMTPGLTAIAASLPCAVPLIRRCQSIALLQSVAVPLGAPLRIFVDGFAIFIGEAWPMWTWTEAPGGGNGTIITSSNKTTNSTVVGSQAGNSSGEGDVVAIEGNYSASGPWGFGVSQEESRMYTALFWTSACLAVATCLIMAAFFTRWNRLHNAAAFAMVTGLTIFTVGVTRTCLQVITGPSAWGDTDTSALAVHVAIAGWILLALSFQAYLAYRILVPPRCDVLGWQQILHSSLLRRKWEPFRKRFWFIYRPMCCVVSYVCCICIFCCCRGNGDDDELDYDDRDSKKNRSAGDSDSDEGEPVVAIDAKRKADRQFARMMIKQEQDHGQSDGDAGGGGNLGGGEGWSFSDSDDDDDHQAGQDGHSATARGKVSSSALGRGAGEVQGMNEFGTDSDDDDENNEQMKGGGEKKTSKKASAAAADAADAAGTGGGKAAAIERKRDKRVTAAHSRKGRPRTAFWYVFGPLVKPVSFNCREYAVFYSLKHCTLAMLLSALRYHIRAQLVVGAVFEAIDLVVVVLMPSIFLRRIDRAGHVFACLCQMILFLVPFAALYESEFLVAGESRRALAGTPGAGPSMIFVSLLMLAAEVSSLMLGVLSHIRVRSLVLVTSLSCWKRKESKKEVDDHNNETEGGRLTRDLKLISPTKVAS